jgi:DNA polymerase-1
VHKVLHGGRRDDPLVVWAAAHDLPAPLRPRDDLTLLDAAL